MTTSHQFVFDDAKKMGQLNEESVDLVVTSPPYPMIEMWDDIMALQNPDIRSALDKSDGTLSFELMHKELDLVWEQLFRVVKPGGIVCINIGDATRTIDGDFQLYSNHARVISACLNLGFSNLPNILWRKQTNAPNKFMGSGMLPPGAYVTLEHEYILIFRKGRKRVFSKEEAAVRAESAYFWEERNVWFSDLWDIKGTKQEMGNASTRKRSGAYPLELAYRLINMYSIKGDTVLDPFLGTGTTSKAALACGRNSVGYEIDGNFRDEVVSSFNDDLITSLNNITRKRIIDHLKFVKTRKDQRGTDAFKHVNEHYGFPVITGQEKKILLNFLSSIKVESKEKILAEYLEEPVTDSFGKESLFASLT